MAALTVAADVDDRLPVAALEKIAEVVAALPEEFELGHQAAANGSVTTTLRFPTPGIEAQLKSMDALLRGSTVIPTMYRNLVEARSLLEGVLRAEADELALNGRTFIDSDAIRHFLRVDA